MSNVIFTQEFMMVMARIATELERMNDLKEKELTAEYGGKILKE